MKLQNEFHLKFDGGGGGGGINIWGEHEGA